MAMTDTPELEDLESRIDSLASMIACLGVDLERVARVALTTFEAVLGDRTGLGPVDYECPDCRGVVDGQDPLKPGTLCPRCQGVGRIGLRHAGTIAAWELLHAQIERDKQVSDGT